MILIASSRPEVEKILIKVFEKYAPEIPITTPNTPQALQARTAACWFPDLAQLKQLPQLQLLHSIAAGVEHLDLAQLHAPYRVCRVLDQVHQQGMLDYLLWGVLYFQRAFNHYFDQAQQRIWQQHRQRSRQELCIGVMGLGHMGAFVAQALADLGYQVRGWSNSTKQLLNVQSFVGRNQQAKFLADCDILINLLPLTDATYALFDQQLFQQLKKGAAFIHCGRGQHLVEQDLLTALDTGQLSCAILDVFEHEPLAPTHPYWQHPKIVVTPHIASHAPMSAVVKQIIDNDFRLQSGQDLRHEVDLTRGY